MHREGHIGLTLLLFSTFSFIFNFWNNTVLVISLIFSVVPDYDIHLQRHGMKKLFGLLTAMSAILIIPVFIQHRNFTIFTIPFSFYLLFLMSEHRGFSHTVVFAILCSVLTGFFTFEIFKDYIIGFLGAFLGVMSHIFGDLLTHRPLTPFYPFYKRKIAFRIIKSSNSAANMAFLILGMVVLVILYKGKIIQSIISIVR